MGKLWKTRRISMSMAMVVVMVVVMDPAM